MKTSYAKGTRTGIRELTLEKLSVTKETLVNVYLATDQAISAGTWTTVNLAAKNIDELDEFDAGTHQFTPKETGWYLVSGNIYFSVTAASDEIELAFYNATDDVFLLHQRTVTAESWSEYFGISGIVELAEGKAYELRGINKSSDDTFVGDETTTFLHIRRMFR